MNELLHEALAPVNVLFTGLLLLVLFYWLTVIIGVLDISSVDVDFDLDADLDLDVDADVDTDVDAGGHGWFASTLHFFNFGKLPFMVIMTFLTLCLWSLSILSNYYLGQGSVMHALMMFIPILFVSLVVTKVLTAPLIPVFEKLDQGVAPVDYIGMTCTVLLPATASKIGQAEVMVDESPLLISVKVEETKAGIMDKGKEGVIVRKAAEKDIYFIQPLN